jgi:hypothetical protein
MRRTQGLLAITAIVGGLITAGMTIAPAHANQDEEIIPVNANAYGNTYGEWSAEWWQWLQSIPKTVNPLLDNTGANCAQQQSGPIFYLVGVGTLNSPPITRKCTVPAGKALFFPILNSIWGAGQGDCVPTANTPCNLAVLRGLAAGSMDSVTLKAVIDGKSVENLLQQRVQSPVLTVTFPADTTSAPEGTYTPNVSDGYWLLLPPLPAGKHTIYFKGVITGGPFAGFVVEVTYKLTVQG